MFKSTSNFTDNVPDSIKDMLQELNITYNESLSITQQKALELLKDDKNLLIVSPAGTGKSFLIKHFEKYIKHKNEKNIAITSTTGISAYNLGGITIHSFMGIGTGDSDIDTLLKKIYFNKNTFNRIYTTDILIIDEISMLSASLFEKLNTICQKIRKNKSFFGGIQIILTGDMNQLLCVFNKNTDIYKDIDERLIIESNIFNTEFNTKNNNIIELTENFRQKNDKTFMELLLRIRNGTYTKNDITLLNTRKIIPDNNELIHIVTSNKKAQIINDTKLNNIKHKSYIYTPTFIKSSKNIEIEDILLKELHSQFKQKGIFELTLKKNARVMLLKNLNTEAGLVNGALGTIISINKHQVNVKFDNTDVITIITPVQWDIQMDGCTVSANQIPLMLAYACTVHKIQGFTLNSGILDIADAFCDHMVYVALSRIKALDGLYLKSFNPSKIKINPITTTYLENLSK